MADVSDAADALVQAVEEVRVALGATWSIYRGWPESAALDAELAAGDVHVTIMERSGFNRLTTRFPDDAVPLPAVPPSLTVTVAGTTATFAGTCSPDQIAGAQKGTTAWVVRCTDASTPSSVAATLAGASGGTASGPVLTLPGLVAARTARDAGTLRPTRQQEVGFTVCVWCSTPEQRDQVAGAIDAALSDRQFLPLADGSVTRLKWAGGMSTDKAENANLYRRDLYYTLEFSTTLGGTATPVLFPQVKVIAAL